MIPKQLRVLGGVEWDRKKLSESNLHVYDKDNTQIVVYNIKSWPKAGGSEKHQKKPWEQITEHL